MLEIPFGPLDIQPFSSLIYGPYTGLVYLTPIFGGILADRVLGHRRTVDLGAFLAPLVCGTLGEKAGWHFGFAAAGIGMLIGLAIYLHAAPLLPPDRITPATDHTPLTREERRSLLALLALFVPTAFFWATYEQQGNTIALWADAN